ncbi:hypothetical protein ISF6_1092 [Piscinibacter sakaiensis]|uniref:Uncharacterized protein n=1 Tax=Piscinibacter sakaiensis TaxID=1547922 RepID=A0A0K8NTX4_PISS1|nr:hypothetical protein ISF6_1092 [Piscinibacter sakaiensis]
MDHRRGARERSGTGSAGAGRVGGQHGRTGAGAGVTPPIIARPPAAASAATRSACAR